jgi:16S rRNA (uracil1498-N3)-methyltransferase
MQKANCNPKYFYLRNMQLFYNPNITNETSQFSFNREESKHIVKVLRKKTGDQLHITNGKGWLFTSEVIIADIKKCSVSIKTKTLQPKHKYNLHLAVLLKEPHINYLHLMVRL